MADPTDPPDWAKNNAGMVKRAFERAQAAKAPMATQPIESRQVKQSAPDMKLTPTGPMRAGADRQAHHEAMSRDEARARQLAESIKKNKDTHSKQNTDKEQER